MRIDYSIVFDRSWRIGSGESAGRYLDSLVRRDALGLPFVPGSTVRGLARDAVRKLAKALVIEICDGSLRGPNGSRGRLCGVTDSRLCALCALTGSPHRGGRVSWGPARLVFAGSGGEVWDPAERERLAEQAVLVPGLLTRPRPRTAIDALSGRAADEHLFTLEEALERLALAGSLESARELPRREVSLLVAALRFIHELGGGRRRGLGACRIRIDRAELGPAFTTWQEAVASLAKETPAEPAENSPAEVQQPRIERPAQHSLRVVQIDAVVVGEVVVGGRPEAGNLISGLPFVPGSALRGALAERWQGDRGEEVFLHGFLSGRVRFGFLYPPAGQGVARPAALSLHTCKLHPGPLHSLAHGVVDLLFHPEAERCFQKGCRGRLIRWSPYFEGGASEGFAPLLLSPHNRIEPASQTVEEGSLFAYEALPEGTRLRGFVEAEDGELLASLLAGLGLAEGSELRLRVGRRKGTLGYLDCRISAYAGRPSGVGLSPDADRVPRQWPGTGRLRVDLVTPVIVVDERLGYRESLVPGDLGLNRQSFDEGFSAGHVLAGWNTAHRLPKREQVAVAAGSSYLLCRPEDGADEELERLNRAARDGIGLRRNEGFGVIAVRAVEADDLRRAAR